MVVKSVLRKNNIKENNNTSKNDYQSKWQKSCNVFKKK